MCGCRRPDEIAGRPIQPKLGASAPPVVLVITRPWYAGAMATCASFDGSASTTTFVCWRRNARSDANGDGESLPARPHAPAATQTTNIVVRALLRDMVTCMRRYPRTDDGLAAHGGGGPALCFRSTY